MESFVCMRTYHLRLREVSKKERELTTSVRKKVNVGQQPKWDQRWERWDLEAELFIISPYA